MYIVSLRAQTYRVPIDKPVRASFGAMYDRPAVLVRVEDDLGHVGWGETWCNFPTVGAEHRARLINETLAPWLVDQSFDTPVAAFEHLERKSHILAIQAGEPGPIAQAIAGVDTALWDLAARRAGLPLYAHLAQVFDLDLGTNAATMPVYASGLSPEEPARMALEARQAGHRAFKLKVGFGDEIDLANLKALRAELGYEAIIAIDANQRWDVTEAASRSTQLADFAPYWLEEPIPADRPAHEWLELADSTGIPLAGGENLRGETLSKAIQDRYFRFVQPDLAKWGGFSAGLPMAQAIQSAGKTYCPHYLGGGIGLMASAHLLAAAGGDGLLEVDSNPNPLRELLADPLPTVEEGRWTLSDRPGLGVEPKLELLEQYRTL